MPKVFPYTVHIHTDFFPKIQIFLVIHTDFVSDDSGRSVVTALVCYLYDGFSEKNYLTDKFPSLLFVRDFHRLQRKILWSTKIALESCSCRNRLKNGK